jgi:hypothetical protein
MKRVALFVGLLSALILMAACGEEEPVPTPTATPVPINEVSFTAADYSFDGPTSIPAGWTHLSMANEGQELHHLTLVKLPEGMSTEDLLTAFTAEDAGPPPPGMAFSGGPGTVAPGGTSNSTVKMEVGEYALVCFVPDANGVPHAALGMAATLSVSAASGPTADPPQSDLTIDLVDFGFGVPDSIAAGTQMVRLTDSGAQDHEILAVQLPEDKSIQDFLAAFEPGAELEGPPPGLPIGGLQPIASGGVGYVSLNFGAGKYGLVCFVEDAETGAPHFALGMVTEIQVQ